MKNFLSAPESPLSRIFHPAVPSLMFLPLSLLIPLTCQSLPRSVFYRPPGTTTEYFESGGERLRLTVYPGARKDYRGAVLFVHGGGWSVGGSDLPLFSDWEEPLEGRRLRAFSMEHRTAPRYRGWEPVTDCRRAIRYLRQNARRFRFPPDRIALVGFSSGGHLAALTALSGSRENRSAQQPRAAVLFFAPLDLATLWLTGNARMKKMLENYLPLSPVEGDFGTAGIERRGEILEKARELSPLNYLHQGAPPLLLLFGSADRLIPSDQAKNFMARARKLRIGQVQLLSVRGFGHNFNSSRRHRIRRLEGQALDFIVGNLH